MMPRRHAVLSLGIALVAASAATAEVPNHGQVITAESTGQVRAEPLPLSTVGDAEQPVRHLRAVDGQLAAAAGVAPNGRPVRSTRSRSESGELRLEVTVTGWQNESLLIPDYPERPVKWLGVPSGGMTGSPSFDSVTREYWWD